MKTYPDASVWDNFCWKSLLLTRHRIFYYLHCRKLTEVISLCCHTNNPKKKISSESFSFVCCTHCWISNKYVVVCETVMMRCMRLKEMEVWCFDCRMVVYGCLYIHCVQVLLFVMTSSKSLAAVTCIDQMCQPNKTNSWIVSKNGLLLIFHIMYQRFMYLHSKYLPLPLGQLLRNE